MFPTSYRYTVLRALTNLLAAQLVHRPITRVDDNGSSRSRARQAECPCTQVAVFTSVIPFFVYGSLMVPDVLQDVLRIEPDSELMPQYQCAILRE